MAETKNLTADDLLSAPLFASEQVGKQMGTSMVLAPHPDDEALGCGGLMQYLLKQNIQVYVCFVTSGGASHPHSIKYPTIKLAEIREKEARKSCEILGVDASNISFLRHPDSLLKDLNKNEKEEIAKNLAADIKEKEISSILLPWRMDPHPDHKVSFELGKRAVEICENNIQIVEYPIWLWKNSSIQDWPIKDYMEIFRLDITPVMDKKKDAIYAHTSQTSKLIDDDPQGFILTEDLLSPFLTSFEYFFFNKEENLNSLSKSYFDFLYSHNPDPWNFRNSEYEKRKYKTIDTYLRNKQFKKGLELGCSIGEHTSHLADHCKKLLAVDISEDAIATAKEQNKLPQVKYLVANIIEEFPQGPFDFISMCEIGYYFNREKLVSVFKNVSNNLEEKGEFLMVHWTSYVREYPLNGKLVHEIFNEFNEKENLFSLVSTFTEDRYELILWKKQK